MAKDKKKNKEVVLENAAIDTNEGSTQETGLVVVTGRELGNTFVPDLFGDIDFNGLSGALDAMADASGELTVEEKEMAIGIVKEWDNNVVTRLREKGYEMDTFINFFNSNYSGTNLGHLTLQEFGPELAEKTNTENEFKAVLTAEDELRQHHDSVPEQPIPSETDSYEDKVRAQKEYEAEMSIHKVKDTRLQKQLNVAIGEWKRALNETTPVKDLLAQARKFKRGVGKMQQTAHDKAQIAKLNISISSKTARDSLRELLNFTTTI